jgi:hypothetical protein
VWKILWDFKMDKLYKSIFLSKLKELMKVHFIEFNSYKIGKDQKNRDNFTGCVLYRKKLIDEKYIWINWVPGEGSARRFEVCLGWSIGHEVLPVPATFSHELLMARTPIAGVCGGCIELDRLEGKNAIGGIEIPSPLDQLLAIKLSDPHAVQRAAQLNATNEDAALTDLDRQIAVNQLLLDVFNRLSNRLPIFIKAVEALK